MLFSHKKTTTLQTQFVKTIHDYISLRAYVLYNKKINDITSSVTIRSSYSHELNSNILEHINDESVWNEIFKELFYEMKYYKILWDEIDENTEDQHPFVYLPQTFQEYVDSIANIFTLGAYDYTEFCKCMKDPKFKKTFEKKYVFGEKMKQLKNSIIHTVRSVLDIDDIEMSNIDEYAEIPYNEPLILNLVPYFEYISKYNIEFTDKKPTKKDAEFLGENMEDNNALFYEKYTLWGIHNMMN